MNRFTRAIKAIFSSAPTNQAGARSFTGGMQSRLVNDWVTSISTADTEIRGDLKTLRARMRDHERNNVWVRRYLKLLENNVLGHNGVGLQMKIREMTKASGKWVETYDTRANAIIETHWAKWTSRKNCCVTRNLSWCDICRISLRSAARDGAAMIRFRYPSTNPYLFTLEPLEGDYLDTTYTAQLGNGHQVRLGVEYDAEGAVFGYHLLQKHPGDVYQGMQGAATWRELVPASEIIHLYWPERFGQSDGFPHIAAAIVPLRMLEGYAMAEVTAARVSASKMGFLERTENASPAGYTGEQADSTGGKYMEVEPGSIEELPYGMTFKSFDPTHPSTTYGEFVKAQLRGISAGLGVSYNSLANDLENVNYSSIRAGLLEEREEWKSLQAWFIDWMVTPVFEKWLEMALTAGVLKDLGPALPATKFDKFNSPEWKPRRWDWVDPLKDLQANVLAVEKGFKSRRQIVGDYGGDIEDTFQDIAADESLAEQYGLDFTVDSGQQANAQSSVPDAPADPSNVAPLTGA